METTGDPDRPGARPARHHAAHRADRRLRLPLRRRGHRPGRAGRVGRLDVPAPDGLAEHLRRGPRPARRARSGSRPTDVSVPAARRYLPGTMVLETSWGTDTGWIIVRDALLLGPWRHETELSQHAAPHPDRLRGRARPAAHDPLREGRGADGRRVRAGPRLRPRTSCAGTTPTRSTTRAAARPTGWDHDAHPDHGHAAGIRGQPGRAPARCSRRATPGSSRCPGARKEPPLTYDDAYAPAGVDGAPLAALAGPRQVPRPPVAQLPAAQRAHAEGPHLRPHRRDLRRGHHLAAGDGRRRAQLRLPLQLDPGRDVRAVGHVLARLRLGGDRLLLLHRRHRRAGRRPADHVRHRRRAGPHRVRARPPARLRQLAPGAHRQRRERRRTSTTCGALCSTPSTCTARPPTTSTAASGRSSPSRCRRR